MGALKGRDIKHICSIPFCKNTDTKLLTRSGEFGVGDKIYICKACATELYTLYNGVDYISHGCPAGDKGDEGVDGIPDNTQAQTVKATTTKSSAKKPQRKR